MSIKEMEELLEATRTKLAKQGRIVDSRLLSKERMLEQAVIDAHLDAELVVMVEDIAYAFLENKGNLTNYWETYNLNEREQRDVRQYLDARMRERNDAHLDAPVTLQDLLTEYKD